MDVAILESDRPRHSPQHEAFVVGVQLIDD
jgi:hypothetical protein